MSPSVTIVGLRPARLLVEDGVHPPDRRADQRQDVGVAARLVGGGPVEDLLVSRVAADRRTLQVPGAE